MTKHTLFLFILISSLTFATLNSHSQIFSEKIMFSVNIFEHQKYLIDWSGDYEFEEPVKSGMGTFYELSLFEDKGGNFEGNGY